MLSVVIVPIVQHYRGPVPLWVLWFHIGAAVFAVLSVAWLLWKLR